MNRIVSTICILTYSLLLLVSCKGIKEVKSDSISTSKIDQKTVCEIDKITEPPGTKEIGDNVYLDRFEISNINYKMFLYQVKHLPDWEWRMSYEQLLPDTSVWDNIDVGLTLSGEYSDPADFFRNLYFRDASFDDYPFVGVSYEQAIEFSRWRTDRVLQTILIENGCIDKQIDEAEFTVDKYFQGYYKDYIPNDSLRFPLYTLIDYDFIRNTEYIDTLDPGHAQSIEYHNQSLKENKIEFTMPRYKVAYDVDRLVGNVAEMTDKKGIAFGGSWSHTLAECNLDSIQNYTVPTNWLGFRNMARLVTYGEYQEYKARLD